MYPAPGQASKDEKLMQMDGDDKNTSITSSKKNMLNQEKKKKPNEAFIINEKKQT